MSSNLYKAAASAELFGAAVYLCLAIFCLAAVPAAWGSAWAPMLGIACVVCSRLMVVHLKERAELLSAADEIDKHERKLAGYE